MIIRLAPTVVMYLPPAIAKVYNLIRPICARLKTFINFFIAPHISLLSTQDLQLLEFKETCDRYPAQRLCSIFRARFIYILQSIKYAQLEKSISFLIIVTRYLIFLILYAYYIIISSKNSRRLIYPITSRTTKPYRFPYNNLPIANILQYIYIYP